MPEMVDIPGFIGNHQIVMLLFYHFLQQHKVGDQDFIHSTQRLKRVQIVFSGFAFQVQGFIDEKIAGRMNRLLMYR